MLVSNLTPNNTVEAFSDRPQPSPALPHLPLGPPQVSGPDPGRTRTVQQPPEAQPCHRGQQQWSRRRSGAPCVGSAAPARAASVALSPTAGWVRALQQSETHSPGPPTQQEHSDLLRVSPRTSHHTGGRHTGKLRLAEAQSLPRGIASKCRPPLGPQSPAPGRAEQRGSGVPAGTASAQPPD